jgi:hypothetical protein
VIETPELALLERLREVLDEPATEAELRTLTERADALVRIASAQREASERRLDELTDDPASSLGDVAAELQRVETVRAELAEARALQAALQERAHELRSSWLRQT